MKRYPLPEELARHVADAGWLPEELREACHGAGEGLGAEDAAAARFRSAARMVEMWRGLDLPAWISPYALRDARLGYLKGYERALTSGRLSEEEAIAASRARWGESWREKLRAARERARGG